MEKEKNKWIEKVLSQIRRRYGLIPPRPCPRDFLEHSGLSDTERLWIIKKNLQDLLELTQFEISGLEYIVKTEKATKYDRGRLKVMSEMKKKIQRCLDVAINKDKD